MHIYASHAIRMCRCMAQHTSCQQLYRWLAERPVHEYCPSLQGAVGLHAEALVGAVSLFGAAVSALLLLLLPVWLQRN